MNKLFLLGNVLFALIIFQYSCHGAAEQKSKPVSGVVEDNLIIDVGDDAGKIVYNRNCKVCHQNNAKGVPGIYPPIVNTKRVKGDKEYLIRVLLDGLQGEIEVDGKSYNGIMASYRNLSDQQIANVLNYLRNSTEADLPVVLAEDVKKYR